MMKELNKLITKDIFDCLSEDEAVRLEELRAKLHIDDEAYGRMKKTITGKVLHERIVAARRKPNRVMKMVRYAAILILPLAVVAYVLLSTSKPTEPITVVRNQIEEKLSAPVRKQPVLVLNDGSVLQLAREEGKREVTSNATSDGNELVYSKNDSPENRVTVEYHTVMVPKGGEYHVVLADGTKVWFNEETELKYPVVFVGEKREVYLKSGEVYLEVARDEKCPFIVHTGNGDIRVLGTQFNVKYLTDQKVATTLVKGGVQVKKGNVKVILQPNQQAVVGEVVSKIPVMDVEDVEEIICWKDNMFLFRDVELEQIMDKLAEWYGFTVFYETPETKSEKFFVRIDKYAEVNGILEVMSEVSNVKFKISGKTVSVYR
ncbi:MULTISPECIES: FecR family protein [Odoribacteraceae]|uniref:FecR family protein n=1 Tax=Odoribacteraceae TaxID=1853231 RepID=UPI0011DD7E9F|nr:MULTISPECIES: FecR family protein [Odoribacteraceae]MCQ4872687.1 FecR domain-containing protein [Butyricimonas paravirosa]